MIDIRRKVVVFGHNADYGKRIMSEWFTKERCFERKTARNDS